MKRLAVLTLVVALASGYWMPIEAQDGGGAKSERQTEKSARQQQTALYKYQKKQEKAQAKAQRKSDKLQRKAAKKYDKEQRRLLKSANVPAKRAA
jgi:hypothetical protein